MLKRVQLRWILSNILHTAVTAASIMTCIFGRFDRCYSVLCSALTAKNSIKFVHDELPQRIKSGVLKPFFSPRSPACGVCGTSDTCASQGPESDLISHHRCCQILNDKEQFRPFSCFQALTFPQSTEGQKRRGGALDMSGEAQEGAFRGRGERGPVEESSIGVCCRRCKKR